jgi:hypothetical protein
VDELLDLKAVAGIAQRRLGASNGFAL